MGIDVVAACFVSAIIDPSSRRGVRVERRQCDQRAAHERRLRRAWRGATGRKRRWAVIRVNPIAHVAQIFSQAMADQNFSGLNVHQRAIHLASRATGQDDLPTETQRSGVYRQPDEFHIGLVVQGWRGEMSTLFRTRTLRFDGRYGRRLDRLSKINQRGVYSRTGRNLRILKDGCAIGRSAVGCLCRIGNELA